MSERVFAIKYGGRRNIVRFEKGKSKSSSYKKKMLPSLGHFHRTKLAHGPAVVDLSFSFPHLHSESTLIWSVFSSLFYFLFFQYLLLLSLFPSKTGWPRVCERVRCAAFHGAMPRFHCVGSRMVSHCLKYWAQMSRLLTSIVPFSVFLPYRQLIPVNIRVWPQIRLPKLNTRPTYRSKVQYSLCVRVGTGMRLDECVSLQAKLPSLLSMNKIEASNCMIVLLALFYDYLYVNPMSQV